MSEITLNDAVQRLSRQIASMENDDICEVYNELFPSDPTTEDGVRGNRQLAVSRINQHIANGLQPEEILDLWNVVFPREKNVSYDEQTRKFQFRNEAFQYAD
jgi:hypothetical protein